MTTPATPDAPPAPEGQFDWSGPTRVATIAAIAGLALLGVLGGIAVAGAEGSDATKDAKSQFMLSYLVGFIFWASLPLGGLALLMIGHLVKSSWGVLLRRPLEAASKTLPLLIILWIPLAVVAATDVASPYWWSHPEETHAPADTTGDAKGVLEKGDPDKRALTEKVGKEMIAAAIAHERKDRAEGIYGFLSGPSFIVVSLVLFAIWGALIFFLNKWTKEIEDAGTRAKADENLVKLNRISGPGLIIYAITTTVAATLWTMSVEPSWSSTMFPVIYAVNQFLTCFAFCLALFLFLASRPPFAAVMRPKFQIDMGTLLLAFTLFWSYTSFSQFMLIWIGNLPEEIPFYLKRSAGGWWWVSAGLIAFHFALPFLLLLFRDIKLHPQRLRAVAIYLLVICAIDVTWWIEPVQAKKEGSMFWLMDIGALAGIGGVYGLYFFSLLKKRPILAAQETFQLPEGHHHEHH